MKRTANIMNVKFNTLFYTALFSGLGVFSFLLLINYAAFPDKVADIFILSVHCLSLCWHSTCWDMRRCG